MHVLQCKLLKGGSVRLRMKMTSDVVGGAKHERDINMNGRNMNAGWVVSKPVRQC